MRIFVCYARRDVLASDRLVAALEARGYEVAIDRRDLPYGELWQAELAEFIRAADTVVWLVSTDSVRSAWCQWELGEVQRTAKRLVPVRIDDVPHDAVPGALGRIHCLPATGVYDEAAHLDELCAALDTDREWVRQHTRLADRAREWLLVGRAPDRILRGDALELAEAWADARPARTPAPASEVVEFILASRRAAGQRRRWQLLAASTVAAVTTALALFSLYQRDAAVDQRSIAEANAQIALENEEEAVHQAALSDALRREAQETAVRTAEQRGELLAGIADQQEDPLVATLVLLEAWAGAGGSFAGFERIDAFIDAGGSELAGTDVPVPASEQIEPMPDYAAITGRLTERLPLIRELRAFGDFEQGKFWSFAPAARRLAMLKGSGEGLVWDVDARARPVAFGAAGERFGNVALSADGAFVAAGTDKGRLHLWDARSGRAARVLEVGNRPVDPVVFAPGQVRVAVGLASGAIVVSDVRWRAGEPASIDTAGGRRVLQGHERAVRSLHWSGDGTRLISAGFDERVNVWDPASGQKLAEIATGGSIREIAVSGDGRRVAARMQGARQLAVWDVQSGSIVFESSELEQDRLNRGLAFSSDGSRLVYAMSDETIGVQSLNGGGAPRTLRCKGGRVLASLFVTDPAMVLASVEDGRICGWSADDDRGPSLEIVTQPRAAFDGLEWDGSGARLLSLSYWGPARMWSLRRSFERPEKLPPPRRPVAGLRFSPDGRFLIGHARDQPGASVWSIAERSLRYDIDVTVAGSSFVITADGARFIATEDGHVQLVDMADGRREALVAFAGLRARSALLSAGRSHAIVNARRHGLGFAAIEAAGRFVPFGARTRGPVRFAAEQPDGDLLATLTTRGDLDIWSLSTGERLLTMQLAHDDLEPVAAEISGDGDWLRVAFSDGTGRRWQLARDGEAMMVAGPGDGEAFSFADEAVSGLAPVRRFGRVLVLDLASGRSVLSLPTPARPGSPVAISPAAGLVAGWFGVDASGVVLLHRLPEIVAGARSARARERARAALVDGRALSDEEDRFWRTERQRWVFREALGSIPRCLSAWERAAIGLGDESPAWCVAETTPQSAD